MKVTMMSEFTFDYDLFVIGGGSGGVRAARLAANTGAKVALAEADRMGGTCVMRGCVPKKLFVQASKFSDAFKDAQGFCWDAQLGAFNWQSYIKKQDTELNRLEQIYTQNLQKSGVTIFHKHAKITGTHDIQVGEETVTAKHILIATGGKPFLPNIPGAKEFGLVSDDMFLLKQQPKTVVIVGAGYIACEFAGIFNNLGSEVTLVHRANQLLRGFDSETVQHVQQAIANKGVEIKYDTTVQGITTDGEQRCVTFSDGTQKIVDIVLFATGRKANTDNLGLESVGIRLGDKGEIPVDAYSQTIIPSIYAIGDVTDRVALTPVAIREAAAFVKTVFEGESQVFSHDLIPSAVFTQPEMACVGLTEEDAKEKYNLDVYTTLFKPLSNTVAGRDEKVFMKLIVDQDSQKVLGVTIVGDNAAEMIQFIGITLHMQATKQDFDATLAVHPTLAEELVTLKSPTRSTQKKDAET